MNTSDLTRRLAALDPERDVTSDPSVVARRPVDDGLLTQVLGSAPHAARAHRAPPPSSRSRVVLATLAVGLGVAVLAAGAVAVLPADGKGSPSTNRPSPTPSASVTIGPLAFTDSGRRTTVRLLDRAATPAAIQSALTAKGLGITVKGYPVSPSLVGSLDYGALNAEPLPDPDACGVLTDVTRCAAGFVLPVAFTGPGELRVGRAAGPTEKYELAMAAFGPGEPFHCAGLINQRSASVVAFLQEKGVRAEFNKNGSRIPDGAPVPPGFVVRGIPLTPTSVLLEVSPERTPDVGRVDAGC